ncbi:hypothetical protein AB4Z29_05225 [Paenibacillus sp. 2TAB23]|uniref:hypothetical protein n=1 Tax=Paenibacillus sp. 2TAB23 TaxID=3233004 RepID=UPI003F992065
MVKGAGLFESSFMASSGIKVGGIAKVTVKGKHITLKDIAIYADGANDSKNLVGAKDIVQWRNAIIEQLKNKVMNHLLFKVCECKILHLLIQE